MVKGCILGLMVRSILELGLKVKWMGLVNSIGPMEVYIEEFTKRI